MGVASRTGSEMVGNLLGAHLEHEIRVASPDPVHFRQVHDAIAPHLDAAAAARHRRLMTWRREKNSEGGEGQVQVFPRRVGITFQRTSKALHMLPAHACTGCRRGRGRYVFSALLNEEPAGAVVGKCLSDARPIESSATDCYTAW